MDGSKLNHHLRGPFCVLVRDSFCKNAEAYADRAYTLAEKGDLDRAMADYNEAIRFDPNLAIAYNNRGALWNRKGNADQAIADFDQTIRIKSNSVSAHTLEVTPRIDWQ
jgi:tetratricopeptide (TPR) repeat protein